MAHFQGAPPGVHGAPPGAGQEAVLYIGLINSRGADVQQVADHFGKYAPCQIQGHGEWERALRFQIVFTGPRAITAAQECRRVEESRPWPYDPTAIVRFFDQPPPHMQKGKGDGKGMDPNFGMDPYGKGKGDGKGFDGGKGGMPHGGGKGGGKGDEAMPPRPANPDSELCVHIGSIDPATDVYVLRDLFRSHGDVIGFDVAPMVDNRGSSAVIEFPAPTCAAHAVAVLNGFVLNGWRLNVEHPRGQQPHFAPGGRFYVPYDDIRQRMGPGPLPKGKGKGFDPLGQYLPEVVGVGFEPTGEVTFNFGDAKGKGKGNFPPGAGTIYVCKLSADSTIDDLKIFAEQRSNGHIRAGELRCFSSDTEPDRSVAGFAFLDMGTPQMAEEAVRLFNTHGRWQAMLANPDVRRANFPKLAAVGDQNLYEIRVKTNGNFSEHQVANALQPFFAAIMPPPKPVNFQPAVNCPSIYYVRFSRIDEAQACNRHRDILRTYCAPDVVVSVELADPALRPESMEANEIAASTVGKKGKQFRPARDPQRVVQVSQCLQIGCDKHRTPHPRDGWRVNAVNTAERLLSLVISHTSRMTGQTGDALAASVRQCLERPEIVQLLRDELVERILIQQLDGMKLKQTNPNAGNGLAPPIAAPTIHMQSPGQAPAAMPGLPPGAEIVWQGHLTRNGGKTMDVVATRLSGDMPSMVSPPKWDIKQRSPFQEVSKRPQAAVLEVHSTNQPSFKEYIAYFKKKARAGLISSVDGISLFVVPPGELADQLAPGLENKENRLLICVSPNASSADKEGLKKLKEAKKDEEKAADGATSTEKPAEGSAEKPGETNGATTSESNAKDAPNGTPEAAGKDGSPKKDDSPSKENRGEKRKAEGEPEKDDKSPKKDNAKEGEEKK